MSRQAEREKRRLEKKQKQQATGFWTDLCDRIDEGNLVPIVSNAVTNDMIFDIDGDGILGISADEDPEEAVRALSIEEQLARAWAKEIDFPLTEDHRMARVALYNSVVSTSKPAAKTGYLRWLKGELLFQAEYDPDVDRLILEELQDDIDQPFSKIVNRLGYPKVIAGRQDPLDLLAKLKLPLYITTSYFDFLERALMANGVKAPRTQVCFWDGTPQTLLDPMHETEHNPTLSSTTPIVYHLFGYEAYPESIVLTEDDCLDFLLKLSLDLDQKEPIVPKYLRKALSLSSVVLLGYRPGDWDFRVMFRGLIAATSSIDLLNLAIQFDPEKRGRGVSAKEIKEYLNKYFQPTFDVEWDSDYDFVAKLYDSWDRRRR